ncbi:MAG TPA: hypothetical protein VLZ05_02880 [Mycobacterium sp.]|nr:hypothetical protein [Mycobacterium sp.]HUH67894.1 hypothetical protein [Mycobacterium sp.]
MPSSNNKPPILSLRSTVLVLCALLVGLTAGGLIYLTTTELAGTILAGGTAFGAALLWLDKIVA